MLSATLTIAGAPGHVSSKMNCTFPEFLAQDLETSSSVFAARNMTAGAPSPVSSTRNEVQGLPLSRFSALSSMSAVDGIGLQLEDDDDDSAPSPGVRYHSSPPPQCRFLGPIEEISGEALEDEANDTLIEDEPESDWDLSSLSRTSSTPDTSSIRLRDASVATTAPSLVSGQRHQDSPPTKHSTVDIDRSIGMSWIDDSDSESEEDEDEHKDEDGQPVTNHYPLRTCAIRRPVAKRLPSKQEIGATVNLNGNSNGNRDVNGNDMCGSVSATGMSTRDIMTRGEKGERSLSPQPPIPSLAPAPAPASTPAPSIPSINQWSAPMNHHDALMHSEKASRTHLAQRRLGVQIFPPGQNYLAKYPASPTVMECLPEEHTSTASLSITIPDQVDQQESALPEAAKLPVDIEEHQAAERTPSEPEAADDCCPPKTVNPVLDDAPERRPITHNETKTPATMSTENIQTWLESAADPVLGQRLDDHMSAGVPLPPDAVDSIRVHITCFPDTMLLTSSLCVETIRTYSRKLRTLPTMEPKREAQPAAGPLHHSPRRWGIGRILSSRRSNGSASVGGRNTDAGSSYGDGASAGTVATQALTAPWAPLRGIFDNGSDYLCEALYAHIAAYNYIAAHCPRSPSPTQPGARPSPTSQQSASGVSGDGTEIPQKAAAFLGLSDAQAAHTSPRPSTSRSPSWNAPSQLSLDTSSPTIRSVKTEKTEKSEKTEAAMRDLLTGLARCIARLVGTLREGKTGVVPEEGLRVDPLLVRALCEIVRFSEEGR